MKTVLSIGNSFSQDAHRYLHTISLHEGTVILPANLYVAGCTLENHYRNLLSDNERYNYEFKGDPTGLVVSLKQALSACPYDAVTLQQASHLSPDYESYQPYLKHLAEAVRTYLPKTKLYLHQTWGYESESERIFKLGYKTYDEMFFNVNASYEKAAKEIGAQLIPCGLALQNAMRYGLTEPVHRDTFHCSLSYGRYLLAATWYMTISHKRLHGCPILRFDDGTPLDPQKIELCNRAAADAVLACGHKLVDS